MREGSKFTVFFSALVLGCVVIALVVERVGARSRDSTACLYEVLASGDSLLLGWVQSCVPPLDIRNDIDHGYVSHAVIKRPCGSVGVYVIPERAIPYVDTFPALCSQKKTEALDSSGS